MEKIALSTYEVAAYWWIKCIKFKLFEIKKEINKDNYLFLL